MIPVDHKPSVGGAHEDAEWSVHSLHIDCPLRGGHLHALCALHLPLTAGAPRRRINLHRPALVRRAGQCPSLYFLVYVAIPLNCELALRTARPYLRGSCEAQEEKGQQRQGEL